MFVGNPVFAADGRACLPSLRDAFGGEHKVSIWMVVLEDDK